MPSVKEIPPDQLIDEAGGPITVFAAQHLRHFKEFEKEVLSEKEIATHANLLMSRILRDADFYLAAINSRIEKGDGRLAYEMIKLIFALVPREQRDQIALEAITPDRARTILQAASLALSPKDDTPRTSKVAPKAS